MADGRVVIDSQFDGSAAQRGARQMANDLQGSMQNISKRIGDVGKKMTKWVTGPVVGAAAGVAGLVKKHADYADQLLKTSSKIGINVEQLQDWQMWAQLNGIEQSTLERGLGRLNQRIGVAIKEGGKYRDALENLGVEYKNVDGSARDTNDVMVDTVKALRDIEDPALRSAMASEIFGTRLARDLMPALDENSDCIEDAIAILDEHGRVTDEQAERAAEFNNALTELKQGFMSVVHEIGAELLPIIQEKLLPAIENRVLPAVREFGGRIKDLIQWFMGLDPWVHKLVLGIIGLSAALGPILMILSPIIKVISFLVPVIKALAMAKTFLAGVSLKALVPAIIGATKAAWGFTAALLANPITWIVALIIGLVAAIIYLWQNWDQVSQWLSDSWEWLKEKFGELVDGIVEWVSELPGRVWDWLKDLLRRWLEWQINLHQRARRWATNIVNTIVNWIRKLPGRVWNSLQNLWNRFIGWINDMLSRARSFGSNILSTIVSFFRQLPGRIMNFLSNALSNLRSWGSRMVSQARSSARNVFNSIINRLRNLPRELLNIGRNMIQNLARGIRNALGSVRDAVGDVASSIRDRLPFSPAKVGPLKDEPDIGAYIGDSIEGAEKEVGHRMSALAGEIAVKGGGQPSLNIRHTFDLTNAPAGINTTELARMLRKMLDDSSMVREIDKALQRRLQPIG